VNLYARAATEDIGLPIVDLLLTLRTDIHSLVGCVSPVAYHTIEMTSGDKVLPNKINKIFCGRGSTVETRTLSQTFEAILFYG
jgi:hypothetical protein